MKTTIQDRARELIADNRIRETPSVRTFEAHGRGQLPYHVEVEGDEARCDCKAGREGVPCYHALAGLYLARHNPRREA